MMELLINCLPIKNQNMKRELIQTKALELITQSFSGILEIAPRVGKTKIGVDTIKAYQELFPAHKILITVPLNPIMETWNKEFEKWGLQDRPKVINQRSLHKEELAKYDLIILDEIHTLSDNQIDVLQPFLGVVSLIGLSGSISWETKNKLEKELGLRIRFSYTIEEAITDGIISNFEIRCISIPLDRTKKYILSGNKGKEKLVTEAEHYKFLSDKFDWAKKMSYSNPKMNNVKMGVAGKRAEFIYTSKSKIEACENIVAQIEERFLLFTARTSVADMFLNSFHSKSNPETLNQFINEEINHLSVCEMTNMGITFPNLKVGIFHQLKSSEESAIQKLLRMCNLEGEDTAKIYILFYKNTVDEDWLMSALKPFNPEKITWV